MPETPEHRAVGDGAGCRDGAPDGRLHPPPLLPRLLRQWLRRVDLARRHRDLHGREECRAERQLGARVRRHRRHQGPGRGGLQRHRLLRRHRRPRRAGQRQPAGWADVDGAAGPPRRAEREPERGERQPPGTRVQPRHPHRHVRGQGALAAGHDGALRRAHDRAGPVRHLPRPHLRRHQHQRHVRGAPAADVPAAVRRRRRRRAGAHRRDDAGRVRQRLLREPGEQAGAVPLGPGAVQRRVAGRAGEGVQAQCRDIRHRLRQGHGEDGQPHAVGGYAHGNQAGLQEDQLRPAGRRMNEWVVTATEESSSRMSCEFQSIGLFTDMDLVIPSLFPDCFRQL